MKFEMKEKISITMLLTAGVIFLVMANRPDSWLLFFMHLTVGLGVFYIGVDFLLKAVEKRFVEQQAAPALGRGASSISEA